MITGRVRLRLNSNHARQRPAVASLTDAPDGAEVILDVGARWPQLDLWVAEELAHHRNRLHFVVEGSPRAVADGIDWLRRNGEIPW